MNLSDVYVFKKVALTLSFTKAARQIGVSRSAVSKQVNRLEQDLGVVLINRTTRSINLTEAGRSFDSNTSAVDKTIERAADLVRGADMSPLGTVSFTLPSQLGAALMPGLITQFQPCWPELRLNIQFDDRNRGKSGPRDYDFNKAHGFEPDIASTCQYQKGTRGIATILASAW